MNGTEFQLDTILQRTVEFFTFKYDFVATTLAGAVLVGAICGLLGVFMVLRRLSMMGDAIGHATLPGVGLAFLVVGHKALAPMLVGASATGLAAALLVGFITRHSRTRPDAALGIVLASFFGLGTVLFSAIQSTPSGAQSGLNDFLFGNAAAITVQEVALLAGLLLTTVAATVALFRPLLLSTFDTTSATLMGLPVRWIHYGLMATVSLTIVASVQAVGVVLVAGLIILPAATARLLSDRFHLNLILATVLGALSGALGAWLSFLFTGFSSGPSMVLAAALFYALALALAPRRGLLARVLAAARRHAATGASTPNPDDDDRLFNDQTADARP